MKNLILRLTVFFSAAILTVVIPVLLTGQLSVQAWTGIGFLVLAEALNTIPGTGFKKKNFPFFLPVRLVVLPGYLVAALVLAFCARFLSVNWLLAIELILCFPVIVSLCIAAMCGKVEENEK